MNRMKNKALNRVLAMILSIIMVIAVIPDSMSQAKAATTEYPDSYTVSVTDTNGAVEGATVKLQGQDGVNFDLDGTTDINGVSAFSITDIIRFVFYDKILINLQINF